MREIRTPLRRQPVGHRRAHKIIQTAAGLKVDRGCTAGMVHTTAIHMYVERLPSEANPADEPRRTMRSKRSTHTAPEQVPKWTCPRDPEPLKVIEDSICGIVVFNELDKSN